MDSGAVQALGVVLDDQLPVAGDVVNDPLAQAELLHAPGVELVGQDAELFGQRPGRFAKVQEDMAVPKPDGDGRERVVFDAKVWHIMHLGRGHELAAEVVGPGVVGAADQPVKGAKRGLAEPGAAMAANVVKRVDCSVVGTGDDQALTGDVAEHVVASCGNLIGPAGVDPHAQEESLQLGLMVGGVNVIAGGKTQRLRVQARGRFLVYSHGSILALSVCRHFRINQTSATWQPRPLAPLPGSWRQVKVSVPSAVAGAGTSNSTGTGGSGFLNQSWTWCSPASSRIRLRKLSPAGSQPRPLQMNL